LHYELTAEGPEIWSVGPDGIDSRKVRGANRIQGDDMIVPRPD
jgi:hypothetical protein